MQVSMPLTMGIMDSDGDGVGLVRVPYVRDDSSPTDDSDGDGFSNKRERAGAVARLWILWK